VFIAPKPYHKGGKMPPGELFADTSVKTVLRTPFDDESFDFIHAKCLPHFPRQRWYKDATVPWPVHVLLGLLDELKSHNIPKEFQPGMLYLYFKFCKGVEIPPPPII
jgi:hypothetical protein